jgi:hypothetical protein
MEIRSFVRLFATVVAVFLLGDTTVARVWKDITGQFSVEAEFVKMGAGVVTLRCPNGRELEVPLAKLSAEDRQFIRSRRFASSGPRATGEGPQNTTADTERPATTPPSKLGLWSIKDLEQALDRPASCDFQQTPFTEAVTTLSQDTGVPILVGSVAGAGILADRPISV